MADFEGEGTEKIERLHNVTPQKWRTDIPHYAKVRYEEVYHGIELVYYGSQRQLKYDFVVAPGAGPKTIKLVFEGADRLTLDAQGNLVLYTPGGKVIQHAPIIYQEINGVKWTIPGRYVLQGKHQVGFQLDAYDTSRPLVIDPVLSYSTYLGGSDSDQGLSVAVDSSGSAYVTGVTASTDFPTVNVFQDTIGGLFNPNRTTDVFVAKFNAAGTELVYSTYRGGSGDDVGYGIAVDADGNIYATETSMSLTDFPTTAEAFKTTCDYWDIFVTKLNGAGNELLYSSPPPRASAAVPEMAVMLSPWMLMATPT